MNLLFRYIFTRQSMLVLLILLAGMALYLLTDVVERLDNFVDSGSTYKYIFLYFAAKLPTIAAQIMPVVFILAAVITLCLMNRNRETIALAVGGVTPHILTLALIVCGLFWGIIQLGCSQFFGSAGMAYAQQIWLEHVRKQDASEIAVADQWVTDGRFIISFASMHQDGSGAGFSAYEVSEDGSVFVSIIRAPSFAAAPGNWVLRDAVKFFPDTFVRESVTEMVLPITYDPESFFVAQQSQPQNLSLLVMGRVIEQLRASGSNVEGLVTAWHARLAYAASLLVMAVIAAAIVSWSQNVYAAVGLAIAITFLYYVLSVLGESIGGHGLLPPVMAAWGPNALLLILAGLRLVFVSMRH